MARVETVDGTANGSDRKRRLRLAHARPTTESYELVEVDEIKKLTITRLRLLSVAKVSVVFWMCAGLLTIASVFMTWLLLTSAGVIGNFEKFVTDMTGVKEFHVMSGTVIFALVLIVCLGIVVGTVVTVVAAAFYNVVAMTLGGVEVVGLEEVLRPVPGPSSNGSNGSNGNGQQVDGTANNGHAPTDVVFKS